MSTIPASAIVSVTPNVLAAGGSALDLSGLLLTTNTRVPIGSVQSFATADEVSNFFGPSATETDLGEKYFNGFDDSNVKPGAMLFAQYPSAAVSAYLRGGDVSALTLAQLQALNGTLSIVIDGVLKTASINLAAATSFSSAAQLIGDALNIHGVQCASITGSIAGTTLTVTSVASGALVAGAVLSGTGIVAGNYITALASGTGGVGTYTVSDSQTALSQAITVFSPGVEYDSVSGAFIVHSGTTGAASTLAFGSGALATDLKLTSVTGAVLSQGAVAATPSGFMTALVAVSQNWASFTTSFNPDASGNTNKLAFAEWTSGRNNRFAYLPWDTDASPTTTVPATSSLGYLIEQAEYSGIATIYAPDATISAFVMGAIASIDFAQLEGRTTLAFRSQAGLVATVTDQTIANNLLANGYNYYGAYATANEDFVFFYDGSVSGPFAWLDSYVNEIWLNNALQLALMDFLTGALSVPFNAAGYARVEAAMQGAIDAGVDFGAIRAGVTLSPSQIAAVNSSAGRNISGTLQTRGWYVKVTDAASAVRVARGPLAVTFWYVDGQSVQTIDLSSIALQ